MIFKYPNGFPFELYFVTGEMLNALAQQAVPYNDLKKIAAYHDKLTFNEVANFIAIQHAAAKLFGVSMPSPSNSFGEGYSAGMVKEAFNEIDSDLIYNDLKDASCFHTTVIGQVIVIGIDLADNSKANSWDRLQARNISMAVQETIYERVGYFTAHFGSLVNPGLGELSMAEVYKFVHIQNP